MHRTEDLKYAKSIVERAYVLGRETRDLSLMEKSLRLIMEIEERMKYATVQEWRETILAGKESQG